MEEADAKRFIAELSLERQALFLTYLSHEITVSARYYYTETDVSRTISALKRFNEIQHRISAQLRYILSSAQAGLFPPDALIDVLVSCAQAGESEPVASHFWYAFARSVERMKS